MGLRINQNIAAMNAYRNLTVTEGHLAKSLEKLSSGYRINRAADDAAGLSISEGLRAQVGGLKVAVRNAQDAISVVQTAEGALTEVHSILQRMRELAVQASNDGASNGDPQSAANAEVAELVKELDRIADTTKFGSQTLLDGTYANKEFMVGDGTSSADVISVSVADMTSSGLSLGSVDLSSASAAKTSIGLIDTAIKSVSTERATLGAYQNRFEHTIANLSVAAENLSASESRIRDTDMAMEMMSFTRSQILQQAGTAMLAQANAAPQSVLSLLR